MSWMGGVFVIAYLVMSIYQIGQINYFFSKGKIPEEIYERVSGTIIKDLLEIVTIIVLFFFKNNTSKNEINEP